MQRKSAFLKHVFQRKVLFIVIHLVFSFSHQTQTTCWDHPKMAELYQSLGRPRFKSDVHEVELDDVLNINSLFMMILLVTFQR